jgi:hypothetical protein
MGDDRDAPLAAWHDWYRDLLASLPAMTTDEIVIAWLGRTRPNVRRLAWDPYPAERAAWPGLYVQPAMGEWWGPEGLAKSHKAAVGEHLLTQGILVGEPGFYFGGQIGHLAKLNEVAVLHQRRRQAKGSIHLPVDPVATPDQEFVWGQVLSRFRFGLAGVSRRKGSTQTQPPPDWSGDPSGWIGPPHRSRAQRDSLIRALLIAGLVFDGMPHREAIRKWVTWEIELAGPWSRQRVVRRAWWLLRVGGSKCMYALRDFEEGQAANDRALWRALGIDPETEPG